jgi:hypothetical protein
MPHRACTVSFIEQGKRYDAKVDAESVYEAACLALKQFRHNRSIKGPAKHAILEIQVEAPMRVKLKVGDVIAWLYSTPPTSGAERKEEVAARFASR